MINLNGCWPSADNTGWLAEPTGYIGKDIIQKYFPPPSDKVKVLVCG